MELVEAMALVAKEQLPIKLVLVGKGEAEDDLRKLINRHNLQDTILMPGSVPHEEILDYYSIFDIMVYPRRKSRLTEMVTPLKPLEAMSMG